MKTLPFGDFASPVALAGALIEGLSELAAAASRRLAVDADVEVLAVLGVGVARVRRCYRLVNLGAGEVEDLLGAATLLLGLVGPGADAGLLREDESFRALDHVELALDAVVEGVAVACVFVGEVAVHARTVDGWDRCLCGKGMLRISE